MISLEEESENYTEMLESMNLSSTSNTNLLNDVELESFGKYILTIGLEIVKYKKNRAKI
jgi:hypothetical protein